MTLDGTNSYVLASSAGVVVVDPGPLLDEHLQRLAAHGPVAGILLTHGHADHAESAARFAATTGAPVRARDPALCVRGEPLDIDGADVGPPGLSLRVLHTPGHTADSVCFAAEAGGSAALLTGDTVLGRGTTVVAHPGGQLGDYLASLRRLARVGPWLLLPGHGPVRPDAGSVAAAYLAHRAERLAQVRAALSAGARTAGEVVAVVYADVDPAVRPAAEQSVRAQLAYLAELGEAQPPGTDPQRA
jgi:glyoxylase-like metal-dependent hydrolase (beta-lactamase superfamily II)